MPQKPLSADEFAKSIGAVPADEFARSIGAVPVDSAPSTTTPIGQSHGPVIDHIYNVLSRVASNVKAGVEQGAHVVADTANQFITHPGLSVEVPLTELARSVGAEERARRILKATHELLHRL